MSRSSDVAGLFMADDQLRPRNGSVADVLPVSTGAKLLNDLKISHSRQTKVLPTVFVSSPSAKPCGEVSAEAVLQMLVPSCSWSVLRRLSREGVCTSSALGALSKRDLRDSGLSMMECNAVLQWAKRPSGPQRLSCIPSWRSSVCLGGGREGFGNALAVAEGTRFNHPSRSSLVVSSANGDQQSAAFWMALTSAPIAPRQQRSPDVDWKIAVQEELFECSSASMHDAFVRIPDNPQDEAILEGFRNCGIEFISNDALRSAGLEKTLTFADFERAITSLKLTQLLGRIEANVMSMAESGAELFVMQYGRHFCQCCGLFKMCNIAEDLPCLRNLLSDAPLGPEARVRWAHLSGARLHRGSADVALLQALALRYRLELPSIASVLGPCPSRVDRHGESLFVAIEAVCIADDSGPLAIPSAAARRASSGSSSISLWCSHVAIFCSGPPLPDMIVTVAQPDWASSEEIAHHLVSAFDCGQAEWAKKIQRRLDNERSRVREHGSCFLFCQIVELCADELVAVVWAFVRRLAVLERDLHKRNSLDRLCDWPLAEVRGAQLQLNLVGKRLRQLQRTLRSLALDPDMSLELPSSLQHVADRVDEAHGDSTLLLSKCDLLIKMYERHELQWQREILESARHAANERKHTRAERTNKILFALTLFTAIFAPMQFFTGIYGMNFKNVGGTPTLPELTWTYGYLYFWAVVSLYLAAMSSLAFKLFRRMWPSTATMPQRAAVLRLAASSTAAGPARK